MISHDAMFTRVKLIEIVVYIYATSPKAVNMEDIVPIVFILAVKVEGSIGLSTLKMDYISSNRMRSAVKNSSLKIVLSIRGDIF